MEKNIYDDIMSQTTDEQTVDFLFTEINEAFQNLQKAKLLFKQKDEKYNYGRIISKDSNPTIDDLIHDYLMGAYFQLQRLQNEIYPDQEQNSDKMELF